MTTTFDPARKADLEAVLKRMHNAASIVYSALQLGEPSMGDWCSRYLKHSKLMAEYSNICEDALARGIDFAIDGELPVRPHRAKTLLKTLMLMYGPQSFRTLCAKWMMWLDEDEAPEWPDARRFLRDGSPSDHLVSAIAVVRYGAHDHLRVWSRGGLAGELVVSEGDGAALAEALGLVEREPQ